MRQKHPKLVWIPEDALVGYGAGQKKTDGVLLTEHGEIRIELAGKSYSAKRLAAIHASHRHTRYRIY